MSVLPHLIRASHTLADNVIVSSSDSGIIPSLPSHAGYIGTSSPSSFSSSSGFFSGKHYGDFQPPYGSVSVSVGDGYRPFCGSVSSGSAAGRPGCAAGRPGRATLIDGRATVINGEVNAQSGRRLTATTTPLTLQQAGSRGLPPQGNSRSPAEGASPPVERAGPPAEYSPRAPGATPITGPPNRGNPHYIEDILGRQRDNMEHSSTGQSISPLRQFSFLNL